MMKLSTWELLHKKEQWKPNLIMPCCRWHAQLTSMRQKLTWKFDIFQFSSKFTFSKKQLIALLKWSTRCPDTNFHVSKVTGSDVLPVTLETWKLVSGHLVLHFNSAINCFFEKVNFDENWKMSNFQVSFWRILVSCACHRHSIIKLGFHCSFLCNNSHVDSFIVQRVMVKTSFICFER